MKNKFSKLIAKFAVVLAACTLFASFSPSLDGRAVVAEEGQFPEGLFAKTVGYLPGDVLSVTNISGNATVDILVIGALDPSEGVAIMLSPEAARAVGIERNSNNIVKITKRTGQDERVFGTAVIARSSENPDSFVASEETVNEEPDFEESSADETEESFSAESEENLPAESEASVASEAEEEAEDFEENTEEDFIEEEYTEDELPAVEEDAPEAEAYSEEAPADFEEEYEEEALSEEAEEYIEEEYEEELESEAYSEEAPADLEEESEEFAEDDDFLEEDEEEFEEESEYDDEEEYADVDEEAFEEEGLEALSEEAPAETEADAEESEEETVEAEDEAEESELYEEAIPSEDENEPAPESEMIESEVLDNLDSEETDEELEIEEETEEYDAIVLIPADDFPPVNANVVAPVEEDEVELVDETPAVEIQPSVVEPVVEAVVVTPAPKTADDFEKYTVNSLSDLISGKYYIQIAVLRDKANISDIINKYGNHYPIVLVPTASGSAKQVLVGPLSVDEYGTVLARFKANGFKDAFLRKIK